MLRRLGFLVRSDERRDVAAAFVYLMTFVGSHTVLETARDALFLSRIPANRLPFVYLAIAALSFVVARVQLALPRGSSHRAMAGWCAFGGVGSVGLGLALPLFGDAGLYVLYVWPGVISSLALVQFWTLLAGIFTATQAKRLFGVVSLGAMIGAIAGSGGMTLALRVAAPRTLVIVSGFGLLVAAALPLLVLRVDSAPASVRSGRPQGGGIGLSGYASALRGPYARRLVAVALLASVTLVFADYVFKTTIVEQLPKDRLPEALGTIYTALNTLSLVVQLAGVGFVLRRMAPPIVLAILPTLLALSGGGVALSGILSAALAVKATDGALRYSLHKTAMELLIVPLSDSARRTVKAAMEVAGQRGGQVFASIAILGTEALGLHRGVSWALAASALAWAATSFRLRSHYVDQFRTPVALSGAMRRVFHAPQLDVASLETLIASLDSESDDEVLAALGILERERKAHLVPTLILYHPDEDVVVAALRLFSRTKRHAALHAIDAHLLSSPSPRVRAEAYAARAAIEPDIGFLRRAYAAEVSPEGRAAIAAVMATSAIESDAEARTLLHSVLDGAEPSARIVVCEVLGWRGARQFDDILEALAGAPEIEVQKSAVHALADVATPRAARALVRLLADEPLSRFVREALARTGEVGFSALVEALNDTTVPPGVRWAIPATLARLDAERAASVLLLNLRKEPDGMVRFRCIVTLGNILEQHPSVRLDRRLLDEEIRINVARAFRYLDRRLVLQRGAAEDPARRTTGHVLLVDLLRDKQNSAIGRVFRLLALAFPHHGFGDIHLAIESGERGFRSTAVELTHNLLRSPLREAVVGLVDDIDDEARLATADGYHEPLERDYEDLMRALLGSSSAIVRDIAAFHVAELGLRDLLPTLASLVSSGRGSPDVTRAVEILEGRSSPAADLPDSPEVAHAG